MVGFGYWNLEWVTKGKRAVINKSCYYIRNPSNPNTSKAGWAKNETSTTDRQTITTPKTTADALAKAAAPIKQTIMFAIFIIEAYLLNSYRYKYNLICNNKFKVKIDLQKSPPTTIRKCPINKVTFLKSEEKSLVK